MSLFKKASKSQARLRMALSGPSGAGKTRTALKIAEHLGERVAVIDSERGSASKYAGLHSFDTVDVQEALENKLLPKPNFHPENLMFLLAEAAKDHDVIIVDSCSLFWNGVGGFLELVDDEVKKSIASGRRGDSFAAWKVVDPIYRRMVQAILTSPAHCLVTLRAKTEYEKKDGKVTKLGLAPEMRDNFQYELDIEGMLDMDNNLIIGKTRCDALRGRIFPCAGKDVALILKDWLSDGAPVQQKPQQSDSSAPEQPAGNGTDVLITLWTTKINAATSQSDLESLTGDIRSLSDDVRRALMPVYKEKKAALAG